MITRAFIFAGMVFIVTTGHATETTDLPARYQAIIEHSPFGQVTGAGVADAAPNWLANFVFSGLIQSNSGNGAVQAIISTKDNAHWYFRAEGESIDAGVTVVKIDQSQRQPKVVLKNGLETGTLTFPERATVAAATPAPTMPQPAPGVAMPQGLGTPPPAGPQGQRRIPFRRSN
jgi:hypothetical protein